MIWDDFDVACAALCAWREARGEGRDGIRAVLHVIANRAKAQNKSWAQVVFARLQFSSMTYPEDPQLTNVPATPDAQFADCYAIAQNIQQGGDFDLTEGATNYYALTIPAPYWAASMTETVQIGNQKFFK